MKILLIENDKSRLVEGIVALAKKRELNLNVVSVDDFVSMTHSDYDIYFLSEKNNNINDVQIKCKKRLKDLRSNKQIVLNLQKKIKCYDNGMRFKKKYRALVIGGVLISLLDEETKEEIGEEDVFFEKIGRYAMRVAIDTEVVFSSILVGIDESNDNCRCISLDSSLCDQKGFTSKTQISITASSLLDVFEGFYNRRNQKASTLVEQYFLNNLEKLIFDKKLHFVSRMFLWTGKLTYKNILDSEKNNFLGADKKHRSELFNKIVKEKNKYVQKVINGREDRIIYANKYPSLGLYNRILLRALFAHTIYGDVLEDEVLDVLKKDDLLELRERLIKNRKSIKVLSTHAVNYLYFLEKVFPKIDAFKISPSIFLEIANQYYDSSRQDSMSKIYLLTHCIIGESRFYAQEINENRKIYIKMIHILEGIIDSDYQNISIDNKLEFIICAKMCGHNSHLENKILNEASNSMSKIGNYIVDMHNKKENSSKSDFWKSEHRNVLFLMASSKRKIKRNLK